MVRTFVVDLSILLVATSGCLDFLTNRTNEDGPDMPDEPAGTPDPVVDFYTHELQGTKPLEVEFHLDFSEVHNRTIGWSIDAESDGTIDANGTIHEDGSAVVPHTYRETGPYNATANVTLDGTLLLHEMIAIQVDTDQTTQHRTFTRTFEYESCNGPESYVEDGEVPYVGDETDTDPDDDDSEKIPSRIDFKATKATWHQVYQAEWSFDASFLEVYAFFTDSDGVIQDHDTDAGSGSAGNLTLHGRIPDPSVWVVLYACGGDGEFTVDYLTPRPGTE